MSSIGQFLGEDHRRCDDFYLATEQAVSLGDWCLAQALLREFLLAVGCHFAMEEQVLFAAYEAEAGMAGPSMIMRGEHAQMRALFDELAGMLENRDGSGFLDLSETLLMLMQQHNLKEERMLYPACDHLLASECDVLIERMRKVQVDSTTESV